MITGDNLESSIFQTGVITATYNPILRPMASASAVAAASLMYSTDLPSSSDPGAATPQTESATAIEAAVLEKTRTQTGYIFIAIAALAVILLLRR